MLDALNLTTEDVTPAWVFSLPSLSDELWNFLIRYKKNPKEEDPDDQFIRAAAAQRADCPLRILNIAVDDPSQSVAASAAANLRATRYVFERALGGRDIREWAPRMNACLNIGVPEELVLQYWGRLGPAEKTAIRRRKIPLFRVLELIREEEEQAQKRPGGLVPETRER